MAAASFFSIGMFAQSNSWTNVSLPPAQRASLLVTAMTLDEKIAMVHGIPGPYSANLTNNDPLGIPALHFLNGPAGVAGPPGVTALPAPILLAATWDTSRARGYGAIIGFETRGKGAQVSEGPMINMVRVPQGGRAFETFGEDPVLSGAIAAEHIRGIQSQGVIANAKHFVANDQETTRGNENSIVDERTFQEIYCAPFQTAVRAGVGSIMGAYNRINGPWSCDSAMLGAVVKVGWGFDGFIECDWGANFDGIAAPRNGLDLETPRELRFGSNLLAAVQSGAVAASQLDEMVKRILTPMFRFGIFDSPTTGTLTNVVTSAAHAQFAYDTAVEGMVLLTNKNNLLPLSPETVHSIAVIGSVASANPIWVGTGSAQVYLPYYDVPFVSISNRAWPLISCAYSQGDSGPPWAIDDAITAAGNADVVVVCVGEQTGEGTDRTNLSLPNNQDELVYAVAATNPRTIVVMYEGAGTLMPWIDQIGAAVVAWYPGQENGRPLAALLFGDSNFSGKLPVTFPDAYQQVPANAPWQFPGTNLTVLYSEGLLMGYRWYDASNISPRFPFGHGLSYTAFGYSNLAVSPVSVAGQVTISCDVWNQGTRPGAEVAQLYLGFPANSGEPPRQLRGFRRLQLSPAQAGHATFQLCWDELAIWDVENHRWKVPLGTFQVFVGTSSRDIRLTGTFDVSTQISTTGLRNYARFAPAKASSISTNSGAAAAVDGDPATIWLSSPGVPQSLTFDLGATVNVSRVRLKWDTNFASAYQIQLSGNGTNWVTVFATNSGAGNIEDLLATGAGRYLQLLITQSANSFAGCTVQEIEVYGPEPQLFPSLSISRASPNNVMVSWPASWGGTGWPQNYWLNWSNYNLQQCALLGSSVWATISSGISSFGGTNTFVAPNLGTGLRYRLRSP
jgi:beta-glucosidase